ncbi:MAG TPA: hypothetical protein VFV50_12020 [Bdellovibrionales bacterium]|nr:hypothetical protein [Bdellovibrionales bacterium]
MKLIAIALALLSTLTARADNSSVVTCLPGDQLVKACVANPQPMDHENATRFFGAIAFCESASRGHYAVGLGADQNPQTLGMRLITPKQAMPLKMEFWAQTLQFVMNVKAPSGVNATFTVVYTKDYTVSSSFQCE